METKTIIEIIDTLVGSIDPVGESHTDCKILENIKQYREITEHMIDQLDEVNGRNKHYHQASIQRVREVAYKFNLNQHNNFKDFEPEDIVREDLEKIKNIPITMISKIAQCSSAGSDENYDKHDYIFLDALFEILAGYEITERKE